MKRGPLPKPLVLRALEGNRSHRALPRGEPAPRGKLPRCPSWLPDEGKEFWRRHVPELGRLGLLSSLDEGPLALLCLNWALSRQAAEAIARDGLTREDENKVRRKHPCFQILRESMVQFERFATHFGLSPAVRAKLNIRSPEDDPLVRLAEARRRLERPHGEQG